MTSSKPQILLCGEVFWAHNEIAELGKTYEILVSLQSAWFGPDPRMHDSLERAGGVPPHSRARQPCTVPLTLLLQPLTSTDRASFLKACAPGGAYSNVTAIYRHGCSASKIGNFDNEVVQGLPSSVKWIAHHG